MKNKTLSILMTLLFITNIQIHSAESSAVADQYSDFTSESEDNAVAEKPSEFVDLDADGFDFKKSFEGNENTMNFDALADELDAYEDPSKGFLHGDNGSVHTELSSEEEDADDDSEELYQVEEVIDEAFMNSLITDILKNAGIKIDHIFLNLNDLAIIGTEKKADDSHFFNLLIQEYAKDQNIIKKNSDSFELLNKGQKSAIKELHKAFAQSSGKRILKLKNTLRSALDNLSTST